MVETNKMMYWVGPKVIWVFPLHLNGKTGMKFLTKPVFKDRKVKTCPTGNLKTTKLKFSSKGEIKIFKIY